MLSTVDATSSRLWEWRFGKASNEAVYAGYNNSYGKDSGSAGVREIANKSEDY